MTLSELRSMILDLYRAKTDRDYRMPGRFADIGKYCAAVDAGLFKQVRRDQNIEGFIARLDYDGLIQELQQLRESISTAVYSEPPEFRPNKQQAQRLLAIDEFAPSDEIDDDI